MRFEEMPPEFVPWIMSLFGTLSFDHDGKGHDKVISDFGEKLENAF